MNTRTRGTDHDWIARQFCYASGYFDNQAEINANREHRIVRAAYQAADRIVEKYVDGVSTSISAEQTAAEPIDSRGRKS